MASDLYATPLVVTDPSGCAFYHTMDIPGHGTVAGQWDLRPTVDRYLGGVDFQDKRVLEMGSASGFLTFHMESRGAEVVAYDLSGVDEWDTVPLARWRPDPPSYDDPHPEARNWREWARIRSSAVPSQSSAFWFAHRAHDSRARLVTGSVYDVPKEIGYVDVATFCSILLHLRDPFRALYRGLRLARETAIVTDIEPGTVDHSGMEGDREIEAHRRLSGPYAQFIPHPACGPLDIWWNLSSELIVRMLGVLGFEDTEVTTSRHRLGDIELPLYTVVGHRTAEIEPLEAME